MATEKQLRTQVLAVTPDAEKLIAIAARQCLNNVDATEIMQEMTEPEKVRLIEHCIKSGHLSVLEHPSMTVAVSGCSRSFLSQITRHRHLSFSVQSQHYIVHSDFGYMIPGSIYLSSMEESYENFINQAQEFYNQLVGSGIPHYDARQILPNAVESRMVISGNFRAWFEVIQKRICKRNTEEILLFSKHVLVSLRQIAPNVFKWCSAPCVFDQCHELKPCGSPYTHREVTA